MTALSAGDSASTLVGVHWGRHRLPFNGAKSYEGLLAGLLLSFLVCLAFTSPIRALAASAVGMLMETLPLKANDNVTVPISVGAAMSVFP